MSHQKIKNEQIFFLKRTVNLLKESRILDDTNYTLNDDIVTELVDSFLIDFMSFKYRHKTFGDVCPTVIAGFMASKIMRYQPWIRKNGGDKNLTKQDGNEIIALYNGFLLCFGQHDNLGPEKLSKFVRLHDFYQWFYRFKDFLRNEDYTPETLILIFDTVKTLVFSKE